MEPRRAGVWGTSMLVGWVALLAACGSARDLGVEPDTGVDTGALDGGAADAGAPDGGAADAGALDGGAADAGVGSDGGMTAPPDGGGLRLPPPNGGLDYQLGGAYLPPAGVSVVGRDRSAPPAPGLYNICYVNGFQIQPDEVERWTRDHPELMLRDSGGDLVIDEDWDEILIDVRTPAKRAAVAGVVAGWIRGCRAAGFDAVEIDNLDSYARSQGLLREDDNVAAMRLFADAAHAEGLPIGQKNSVELVSRRAAMGTDFAVVEECNRYDECDAFTAGYGAQVYIIEYRRADFQRGCAAYPGLSIVLRDLELTTPGEAGYVREGC